MTNKNSDFLGYYDKYKDKIYNYFWYRLNFNQQVAEDLTSEVFIKAFSHFDSFDLDGSFQAWIYMIARNHFINYCKKAGREVSLETAGNLANNSIVPVNALIELEKVLAVISQLDSYSREVLLLKFVDGLDNQEIAQMLNKEEGAVRTQLSRATAILKEKVNYGKY